MPNGKDAQTGDRQEMPFDQLARQVARQAAAQAAIRPFLTRPLPHPDPGDFFTGEATHQGLANQQEGGYLYHTTTLRSLGGILRDGLVANRGGQGGAGTVIAGQGPNEGFNAASQGFVHAADMPAIVDNYTHEYDRQADGGDILRAPVVLRFQRENTSFVPDEDEDDGAVKTCANIAPERLEILSNDGWVSLAETCTRANIFSELQEMFSKQPPSSVDQEDMQSDHRELPSRINTPPQKKDGPSL